MNCTELKGFSLVHFIFLHKHFLCETHAVLLIALDEW